MTVFAPIQCVGDTYGRDAPERLSAVGATDIRLTIESGAGTEAKYLGQILCQVITATAFY